MRILNGHRGAVYVLAFSPDGRYLASVAGSGREVWLWDLTTEQVANRWEHERKVVSLSFGPSESSLLASCDTVKRVHLCSLTTGKGAVVGWFEDRHSPLQAMLSPDGKTLAINGTTESLDGRRSFLSVRTGVSLWAVQGTQSRCECELGGFLNSSCLTWSPDGTVLAVGSFDRSVTLLNIQAKQATFVLRHHAKVHFLAYSPDGRYVVAGTPHGLIRVWETATGHQRHHLRGQDCHLHALSFSPDGHTLASAGLDGKVRLWDVNTGRPRDGFDWGIGEVHSVAFASDGMRAAAGGENAIVLWDIDSW